MFVPFNKIAPESRVWIYQLSRELSEGEKTEVEKTIEIFCQEWQAHGAPLKTSYLVAHNHFLILAVDEKHSGASGCSIDGSVRMLKDLGAKLGIDFFDRMKAAFLVNEKVELYPVMKLKELFESGMLNPASVTFNNMVATKMEFLNNWRVEAGQSWLSKYLPKSALAK